MDFATFIKKYYNKLNPKTSRNWGFTEIKADSGVDITTVEMWIAFAMRVQSEMVKLTNKMPTDDDIIARYNKENGIVATPPLVSTTPVPLPPRDPSKCVATPFGLAAKATKPTGVTTMLQYTPDQFEELMHHILCEHDALMHKG